MRLLQCTDGVKFKRTKWKEHHVSPYAVISHTWGREQDEVGFNNLARSTNKPGFQKLKYCAQWAKEDGLTHFWIDTCCISRDGSEDRHSKWKMFEWYKRAAQCYVYMVDVPEREERDAWDATFRGSRWFTRGWTLPELLAPSSVKFYSHNGKLLGDKRSLERQIQQATGIPVNALRGAPLKDFSVAERLSWASQRQTSVPEDAFYCLSGLFEIPGPCVEPRGSLPARQVKRLLEQQLELDQESAAKRVKQVREDKTDAVDRHYELLKILRHDEVDRHYDNIKEPYGNTGRWLLGSKQYLDWRNDSDYGALWLRGHAGTGKSTLAKFLVNQLNKTSLNIVVLSFFPHVSTQELAKSTAGLYRRLIIQLLEQKAILESFRASNEDELLSMSNVEELKTFFNRAMRYVVQETIIIMDGLLESQIEQITSYFDQIREHKTRLRCVYISKYYAKNAIQTSHVMNLEEQGGHVRDVVTYITDNLHDGDKDFIQKLQQGFEENATGCFLRAVLTVLNLNRTYDGELQNQFAKLKDISNDVNQLCQNLLSEGFASIEEMRLCL